MNLTKIGTFLLFMMIAVLLAACGGTGYKPHAVNEETDRCAVCKMAVKDDPHAVQIITKEGRSLKFDDIGCMRQWQIENGTENAGAVYVRDYFSMEWLPYDQAYYVYDANIQTPMAYGILSFQKESDAQAFIQKQGAGKLMKAEELDNHTWERNREMMKMGGMNEHTHDGESGMMQEHHADSGMNGSGGHGS